MHCDPFHGESEMKECRACLTDALHEHYNDDPPDVDYSERVLSEDKDAFDNVLDALMAEDASLDKPPDDASLDEDEDEDEGESNEDESNEDVEGEEEKEMREEEAEEVEDDEQGDHKKQQDTDAFHTKKQPFDDKLQVKNDLPS